MYVSPLFRMSLEYARTLAKDEDIFILSAKYGLIRLSTRIEPYEQTLNRMTERQRKSWAVKVIKQAQDEGIAKGDGITVLAGANYAKWLKRHYANIYDPMDGLPLGKRLT